MGFCSIIHFPHAKNDKIKKVHRLVVLPDYQGIGIGVKLCNHICDYYKKKGFDIRITTSTPALINSYKKSKKWICTKKGRNIQNGKGNINLVASSGKRITTTWKYLGDII